MTQLDYYNLTDEVRDRLQRKSYWLFKSKHRWRKIEDKLNCGVEELERQFDVQINLHEQKLQLMKKLQEEKANVKAEKENVGEEVRPTEAGSESVNTGS